MERRTIPEPVVRSPRWAAIEAAVEKVMARKALAQGAEAGRDASGKKHGATPSRKSD